MWKHCFTLAALALVSRVSACIQAHTLYVGGSILHEDGMSLQVWVNGQLVCYGADSHWFAAGDTEFALRNSDGQGSGCAPGYSFVTTGYGRNGTFSYFENGKAVYSVKLDHSDYEQGTFDCDPCHESDGETKCTQCTQAETANYYDTCDNLPEVERCEYKDYCDNDLPHDPAEINPPNPFPFLPFKVMVVGDSLSHGMESDWTWRYRVWDWLKGQGYKPTFVGPYTGTYGPILPADALPVPPLLQGETAPGQEHAIGLYASGVSGEFASSGHAAWWGRQAAQDQDQIQAWVKTYQPDYIMCMLGFNDMGWFISDAKGTILSMDNIVDRARAAKPDVKFLMANVVQRSRITGRQDLIDNTSYYNGLLKTQVSLWNQDTSSPIAYVDVENEYNCQPDNCPDGWDGLHPTALGEFHMAKAFADVWRDTFKFLGQDFEIPDEAPSRDISTPTGFHVEPVQEGILAAWNEDLNARGYNIRARAPGLTDWLTEGAVSGNAFVYYYTWCLAGQKWEFQVATIGDHGTVSDFTSSATATCNPDTAPGPSPIITQPSGDDGISLSWPSVSGYSVNRYEVYIWDQDVEGSFVQQYATTGNSFTVNGLAKGHRYGCWVSTWVNLPDGNNGGGWPNAARSVIPGQGAPGLPTGLTVTNVSPTTVKLSWDDNASAAGYNIQVQSLLDPTNLNTNGTTTGNTYEIAYLYPGTWHYEFCIHAYNGNLETACTAYVTPPVYPGWTKRDSVANISMANVSATPAESIAETKAESDLTALGALWTAHSRNVTIALPSNSSLPA